MPPKDLDATGFRGAKLENIYVLPEYYENYKNKQNLTEVFVPLVSPIKLYSEGYVRIIKDGAIYYGETPNKLMVGNIELTEMVGDYFMYNATEDVFDTNVYLNDEKIGQILGPNTTIYLGDNSSLLSGDGYNFRYGVYDENIKTQMENNGWVYDVRFEGLRSTSKTSEITLEIPNMANVEANVCHGLFSHQNAYSYVKDSNNNVLLKNSVQGYNINNSITSDDGIFKVGYTGNNNIVGIDAMILHEIGNVIYTDPELTPTMELSMDDEPKVQIVTVTLNAPVEIPGSVYVTVTDNKAHTYRKFWNGEPLVFVLPNRNDFVAYATNFVTETGKLYVSGQKDKLAGNVEITFTGKDGIELVNNILGVYTNDSDWYININKLTGSWSSSSSDIESVVVGEIIMSDADGFENTKNIAEVEPESIFAQAIKFNKFENGIVGYIPSYIELELFKTNLNEINSFLVNKGKPEISLDNVWVSEAFDTDNAWTSDGEIMPKNSSLNYYIFGKRII